MSYGHAPVSLCNRKSTKHGTNVVAGHGRTCLVHDVGPVGSQHRLPRLHTCPSPVHRREGHRRPHEQHSSAGPHDQCAAGPPLISDHRHLRLHRHDISVSKGSPYSITDSRVPELIPVLGSQPAGEVSHKPRNRLPLLSARPAVTLATLKRATTNFAAW